MPFTLPPLPYDTAALAPYMDPVVVDTHYNVLTRRYFDTARELSIGTPAELCATIPEAIHSIERSVRYPELYINLLDAVNHAFFWENLAPVHQTGTISKELLAEIEIEFGSVDNLKRQLTQACLHARTSAPCWVWLIYSNGKLRVTHSPIGYFTIASHQSVPLLVIDTWEHAYYQQYPADATSYIDALWNIINWGCVSDRFAAIGQ